MKFVGFFILAFVGLYLFGAFIDLDLNIYENLFNTERWDRGSGIRVLLLGHIFLSTLIAVGLTAAYGDE